MTTQSLAKIHAHKHVHPIAISFVGSCSNKRFVASTAFFDFNRVVLHCHELTIKLANDIKTFLVVAEVFKQDISCFNSVEACPNLVDLLFSEFVKGILVGIEAIDINLVFVGIFGNGNRDFRCDILTERSLSYILKSIWLAICNLLTNRAHIEENWIRDFYIKQAIETDVEQLLVTFTEIFDRILCAELIARDGLHADKDDFLLGDDLSTERETVFKVFPSAF
ncbi:hypothetical protein SORDD20_01127 [Streptococcus oralis]|nr:hypothetical protein SORDD20_01127 [Streptococcus oralis]